MALDKLPQAKHGLTYVPTLTAELNVQVASVLGVWKVTISGSIVTVMGKLSVDPTAASLTVIDFSLPFPKNFTDGNDIAGLALSAVGSFGSVVSNISEDRAQLGFVAQGTAAETLDVVFSYDAES